MRIDTLSNAIIAQYVKDERLRADRPADPGMEQYIREERLGHRREKKEKSDSLRNPPVPRYKTDGPAQQSTRSPESGAILVAQSIRDPQKIVQTTIVSAERDFGEGMFQDDDQFFLRVRTAYAPPDSFGHKGLHVDTRV